MSIVIDDGIIVKVSQIGTITLQLKDRILGLNITLCISHLRKNMISIQKITSDFPFEFRLTKNGFIIENLQTKVTILTSCL